MLRTQPDWAVFDLDPFEPATFQDVVDIAKLVKAALDHYGMHGVVKTSGQTGLQIYVPVRRGPDYSAVRHWVEEVGRAIDQAAPGRVSWEWAVAKRTGRIRIDYTQNIINKTLAAPYSLRPAPGAPVSTPITWEELDDPDLRPDRWNITTIAERVAEKGRSLRAGAARGPGPSGRSVMRVERGLRLPCARCDGCSFRPWRSRAASLVAALRLLLAVIDDHGADATLPVAADRDDNPIADADTLRDDRRFACMPGQFEIAILNTQGAAGTIYATFEIRNTSTADCTENGYAKVQMLTSGGGLLNTSWIQRQLARRRRVRSTFRRARSRSGPSGASGHGYFLVSWSDVCTAAQAEMPKFWQVTLPTSRFQTDVTDVGSSIVCSGAHQGRTDQVRPIHLIRTPGISAFPIEFGPWQCCCSTPHCSRST